VVNNKVVVASHGTWPTAMVQPYCHESPHTKHHNVWRLSSIPVAPARDVNRSSSLCQPGFLIFNNLLTESFLFLSSVSLGFYVGQTSRFQSFLSFP
jgi:hypothetical protein